MSQGCDRPARSSSAGIVAACDLGHLVERQPQLGWASWEIVRRTAAGFAVRDVPEGHLCCGSAGTYNLLQPGLAGALRARKLRNIATTRPDAVATGNIGCIAQLSSGAPVPVLHTVELLDWATGGPKPAKLVAMQKQEYLSSVIPAKAGIQGDRPVACPGPPLSRG